MSDPAVSDEHGPDSSSMPSGEEGIGGVASRDEILEGSGSREDAPGGVVLRTDGCDRPIERGWLACERVSWWIFNACALGVTWGAAFIVKLSVNEPWWVSVLIDAGWALLASVLLWAAMWFLPRSYRAMSWAVHPDRVSLRKGVWWRRAITVPRVRVQHTDVKQGPLQRRFGIATLVIHTAGTQHAKVELPGLSLEAAEHLRDWLIEPSQRARAVAELPNAPTAHAQGAQHETAGPDGLDTVGGSSVRGVGGVDG